MTFMSVWNTVKYGWIFKTKIYFSEDSPIWLLGRCYRVIKIKKISKRKDLEVGIDAAEDEENIESDLEGMEEFMLDFVSKIWLTYRKNFPVIQSIDDNYNSDCGWGCMLRCGQMMLAQGFVCHFLGRNWRWMQTNLKNTESLKNDPIHWKIIQLFGDFLSPDSPLSIHNLVYLGQRHGKEPKDLYGPTLVAHLLKEAVDNAREKFKQLRLYVANDCVVYLSDIFQTNTENCDNIWKPVIILIPLHLGSTSKSYLRSHFPFIINALRQDNCIGIMGGRSKSYHAQYFIGCQDYQLIYLDPHYCQKVDFLSENSYHCRFPRKMNIYKMNPSCCIGFYCRTKNDFLDLKKQIQIHSSTNALITFCDGDKNASVQSVEDHVADEFDFSEDFIIL